MTCGFTGLSNGQLATKKETPWWRARWNNVLTLWQLGSKAHGKNARGEGNFDPLDMPRSVLYQVPQSF